MTDITGLRNQILENYKFIHPDIPIDLKIMIKRSVSSDPNNDEAFYKAGVFVGNHFDGNYAGYGSTANLALQDLLRVLAEAVETEMIYMESSF